MKPSKLQLILTFLRWSKTWAVPRCLFSGAYLTMLPEPWLYKNWMIERRNNDFEGSYSDLTCRKLPELAKDEYQNPRPSLLVSLWHFLRTSSDRFANLLGDHLFPLAASDRRYTPLTNSRE
jgi:hypothetical protein